MRSRLVAQRYDGRARGWHFGAAEVTIQGVASFAKKTSLLQLYKEGSHFVDLLMLASVWRAVRLCQ